MGRSPAKVLSLVTIVAFLLMVAVAMTYKRDTRFETFINDLSVITDEIVEVIEAKRDAEGIVLAHAILNERKGELKRKLAELKTMRGSQVGDETLRMLKQGIQDNRQKLNDLFSLNPDLIELLKKDKQFKANTEHLLKDYTSIIQ
jgi:hypothetical protein